MMRVESMSWPTPERALHAACSDNGSLMAVTRRDSVVIVKNAETQMLQLDFPWAEVHWLPSVPERADRVVLVNATTLHVFSVSVDSAGEWVAQRLYASTLDETSVIDETAGWCTDDEADHIVWLARSSFRRELLSSHLISPPITPADIILCGDDDNKIFTMLKLPLARLIDRDAPCNGLAVTQNQFARDIVASRLSRGLIAFGSSTSGHIHLYDFSLSGAFPTQDRLHVVHRYAATQLAGRVFQLSFSPDGRWLAACNGTALCVWSTPRSTLEGPLSTDAPHVFFEMPDRIVGMNFLENSTDIAVATINSHMIVANVNTRAFDVVAAPPPPVSAMATSCTITRRGHFAMVRGDSVVRGRVFYAAEIPTFSKGENATKMTSSTAVVKLDSAVRLADMNANGDVIAAVTHDGKRLEIYPTWSAELRGESVAQVICDLGVLFARDIPQPVSLEFLPQSDTLILTDIHGAIYSLSSPLYIPTQVIHVADHKPFSPPSSSPSLGALSALEAASQSDARLRCSLSKLSDDGRLLAVIFREPITSLKAMLSPEDMKPKGRLVMVNMDDRSIKSSASFAPLASAAGIAFSADATWIAVWDNMRTLILYRASVNGGGPQVETSVVMEEGVIAIQDVIVVSRGHSALMLVAMSMLDKTISVARIEVTKQEAKTTILETFSSAIRLRIVKGENDLSLVVSGAVGSRDDALVAVDDFNSVMFQSPLTFAGTPPRRPRVLTHGRHLVIPNASAARHVTLPLANLSSPDDVTFSPETSVIIVEGDSSHPPVTVTLANALRLVLKRHRNISAVRLIGCEVDSDAKDVLRSIASNLEDFFPREYVQSPVIARPVLPSADHVTLVAVSSRGRFVATLDDAGVVSRYDAGAHVVTVMRRGVTLASHLAVSESGAATWISLGKVFFQSDAEKSAETVDVNGDCAQALFVSDWVIVIRRTDGALFVHDITSADEPKRLIEKDSHVGHVVAMTVTLWQSEGPRVVVARRDGDSCVVSVYRFDKISSGHVVCDVTWTLKGTGRNFSASPTSANAWTITCDGAVFRACGTRISKAAPLGLPIHVVAPSVITSQSFVALFFRGGRLERIAPRLLADGHARPIGQSLMDDVEAAGVSADGRVIAAASRSILYLRHVDNGRGPRNFSASLTAFFKHASGEQLASAPMSVLSAAPAAAIRASAHVDEELQANHLVEMAARGGVSRANFNAALHYALKGDIDAAFEWAAAAFDPPEATRVLYSLLMMTSSSRKPTPIADVSTSQLSLDAYGHFASSLLNAFSVLGEQEKPPAANERGKTDGGERQSRLNIVSKLFTDILAANDAPPPGINVETVRDMAHVGLARIALVTGGSDEAIFFHYEKAKSIAHAQFVTACCYEYGHGVRKDQNKAIERMEKAVEMGHVDAMQLLGRLYELAGKEEKAKEVIEKRKKIVAAKMEKMANEM